MRRRVSGEPSDMGANLPVGAAREVAPLRRPRTTAPPLVREIRSLCAKH